MLVPHVASLWPWRSRNPFMTCSLCGGVCGCTPDQRSARIRLQTQYDSNAQISDARGCAEDGLRVKDFDGGEREFAASLGRGKGSSRPKFIVEGNDVAGDEGVRREDEQSADGEARLPLRARRSGGEDARLKEPRDERDRESSAGQSWGEPEGRVARVQPNLLQEGHASSWREEVSERLHRYHARRRPRAPRYPSLRLKFETPETNWSTPAREIPAPSPSPQPSPMQSAMRQAVAIQYVEEAGRAEPASREGRSQASAVPVAEPRVHEGAGKIIEFPRTMYALPSRLSDLADPVMDRPRILEAPELTPPPPALGGMTIEETAKAEPERRPGIDMPLQSARLGQRLLAAAIDGVVVLSAAGLFGGIFYKMTRATPSVQQMAVLVAELVGVFWAGYQYLLMVHSGTTAGLRLLKLRVQRFDGKPASRQLRRWRVLGSMLSGASLGMGYAWFFLDEDGLCWHERVSKTHIASEKQGGQRVS